MYYTSYFRAISLPPPTRARVRARARARIDWCYCIGNAKEQRTLVRALARARTRARVGGGREIALFGRRSGDLDVFNFGDIGDEMAF